MSKMSNNIKLEDDHFCFACGSLNNSGLKLNFILDEKNQTISTEFTPKKIHQGYKDIVHGGLIGLIMDECMVNLAWKLGMPAVSAEYNVRLYRPAMIGKTLKFTAKITSHSHRILIISAECLDKNTRQRIATSSAKCVRLEYLTY